MKKMLTNCWVTLSRRFKLSIPLLFLLSAIASAQPTGVPKRIVTLIPSLGELAADLLEQEVDRIVGVSSATDFPPALKKVQRVGPYHRLNLERVAALRPDLIIASRDGNQEDQINHLREVGLRVEVINTRSLKEIVASVKQVGRMLGKTKRGIRLASQIQNQVDQIQRSVKGKKSPRVLMQLGDEPLVIAGEGSFLGDLLRLVGGKNLYSDRKKNYPRPRLEDVLKRDPEVILILTFGNENEEQFIKMKKRWMAFSHLSAVKSNRIYLVRDDGLLRPGLRLPRSLERLRQRVHGR